MLTLPNLVARAFPFEIETGSQFQREKPWERGRTHAQKYTNSAVTKALKIFTKQPLLKKNGKLNEIQPILFFTV